MTGKQHYLAIFILAVGLLMAACTSAAPTQALPTATALPQPAQPTATATQLPPPTPTPFPTATPPPPTSEDSSQEATTESTESPAEETSSSPTQTAPESTVNIERGEIFYSSQFTQGWPSSQDTFATLEMTDDDRFLFEITENQLRYMATTNVNTDNMFAQVEITPEQCPQEAGYGLFFRFVDVNNYYAVTVFCSGRVMVFTRVDGNLVRPALLDETLPAGIDPAANEPHTVAIGAKNDSFVVIVDGQTVGEFNSDQHAQGDLALYAVGASGQTLRVLFDNLEVWTVQ